ncbi:hypothetical protein AKJ61_04175 [candidate division MSBL1 archaeon SCGC-AAA259B11]|uniref:Uncharacterized protein n=1 Tax=candidate division MSBL1 archaeon SCGC-AAA259B11 TaxID=1698260 RepID=A0A133U3N8_9EURY|nr:hypothetical protein AKJ61_04175 [candidate division MSBL1 archaeon SCGC-AAA259B11]
MKSLKADALKEGLRFLHAMEGKERVSLHPRLHLPPRLPQPLGGDHGEIIERAKDQLRRFAYAIWRERQPELRCLLTASDGVHNFVYRPSLKGDLDSVDLEGVSPFTIDKKLRQIIDLEEISRQDFSRGDPERVCKWLERIIFGRLSDG